MLYLCIENKKQMLTMRTFMKIMLALALLFASKQIKAQQNMALNARQQSLSAVAGLEAKGDLNNLGKAINEGLENGLTVAEIKEALSQLYAYTGFPRSLNALGTLQKVVSDRKEAGKPVNMGQEEATVLPKDFDALKVGTEVQTQLTGKPFTYTFAPRADYYLKAHLFGDIFASQVLSKADREVVTVSAIASLKGCDPQLAAHCMGALNMGVKEEELRSIPAVLEAKVGAEEAYRCRKAIAAIKGEDFKEGQPVDFSVWPKGEPNVNYAQYFDGNSYLAPLDSQHGGPAMVTFEPACRNHWHIHHKGVQVLVCVSGRGWYQEWGKEAVEMTPGTVIAIPAEVKHWHGAAKDSWFQHIAYMTKVEEGASNEWLEAVKEEDYNKLK
jgi:4-carboxymuconolactone decarboxylase